MKFLKDQECGLQLLPTTPFLSTDDPRFSWLKNQFSKHFEDWLGSIEEKHIQNIQYLRNKI